MTWFQAIFLGMVQGLTEFLPISSSAHLVLIPYLFNWSIPDEYIFPFDVLVQLGTLVAVIIYFWKDLWAIARGFIGAIGKGQLFSDPDARLGWYLILATLPAALIGLLITETVEAVFQSPVITAGFLLVTAAILFIIERVSQPSREFETLSWRDALWIGFSQALALFPGISRSGITISAGVFRNLTRPAAARFSFLMSVPVMLGAGLLSILKLGAMDNLSGFIPLVTAGIITSAVVGYYSIHWLLSHLNRRSLLVFSAYCTILAVIVLVVAYVR